MKIPRKLFACLLSISVWSGAYAEWHDYTDSQGVEYSIYPEDGYSTLDYVPESLTTFVIPSSVQGYELTDMSYEIFRNHPNLVTVTNNSSFIFREEEFSGCTSLKRVAGMKFNDYDPKLPDRIFYNCPNIDLEDLSWLPSTISYVGDEAFALSDYQETPSMTIPTNWIEFKDDTFDNRKFQKVTIPYSPIVLGSEDRFHGCYLNCEILEIEREFEYLTFNMDSLREFINREHYLGEHDFGFGNVPNLQRIVSVGLGLSGRLDIYDCPLLEEVDFSGNHNTYTDVLIRNCQQLKSISLPDEAEYVSLSDLPLLSAINAKSIGSIGITEVGISDLDLSECNVFGEDREVSISNCNNLKTAKLPLTGEYALNIENNPILEELYFDRNAMEFVSTDNGRHDIIFGSEISEFLKYSTISYEFFNTNKYRSNLENVDHLWYGHGFAKQTYLTDLVVDDCESIGNLALAKYGKLKSVKVGSNVKSIGYGAFADCPELTTANINSESISCRIMARSANVSNLTVGTNLKKVIYSAFDLCGSAVPTKVFYEGTPDQMLAINYTTTISEINGIVLSWVNAFNSTTPAAIADGGLYFEGKLAEDIVFNNYIASIPDLAFKGVETLRTVTFTGNYPAEFNFGCFMDCSNLTSITCSNTNNTRANVQDCIAVGSYAFENDVKLERIDLMPYLRSSGENSFQNTAWLNNQPEGIVYGGNVLLTYKGEIPQNANLTVKEGITYISENAFSYKNSSENIIGINLPEGLEYIGANNTFDGLAGTFELPSTVVKNESYIGGEKLKGVILRDGELPIEECGNIDYRTNLTDLYIGRSFECTNNFMQPTLERITIGPIIREVSWNMLNTQYYGDPESLQYANLSEITCLNPVPPVLECQERVEYGNDSFSTIMVDPFYGIDKSSVKLSVPEESLSLYREAEGWKDFYNIQGVSGINETVVNDDIISGVYDLNGIEVAKTMENLPAGVYIVKKRNKTEKVIIR